MCIRSRQGHGSCTALNRGAWTQVPGRETGARFLLEKVTGRGKHWPLGVSFPLAEGCCHRGWALPGLSPRAPLHCTFGERDKEDRGDPLGGFRPLRCSVGEERCLSVSSLLLGRWEGRQLGPSVGASRSER